MENCHYIRKTAMTTEEDLREKITELEDDVKCNAELVGEYATKLGKKTKEHEDLVGEYDRLLLLVEAIAAGRVPLGSITVDTKHRTWTASLIEDEPQAEVEPVE